MSVVKILCMNFIFFCNDNLIFESHFPETFWSDLPWHNNTSGYVVTQATSRGLKKLSNNENYKEIKQNTISGCRNNSGADTKSWPSSGNPRGPDRNVAWSKLQPSLLKLPSDLVFPMALECCLEPALPGAVCWGKPLTQQMSLSPTPMVAYSLVTPPLRVISGNAWENRRILQ